MPLDAHDRQRLVFDGLDRSVTRTASSNPQAVAESVDRLVVDGIHGYDVIRKRSPEPRIAMEFHGMDVVGPPLRPVVVVRRRQMLDERAPEIHVDELHAFAYAENGLPCGDCPIEEPVQEPVVFGNEIHGPVDGVAIERRIDVRAAGKHEGVEIVDVVVDGARVARNDVGDPSGFFDGRNVAERDAACAGVAVGTVIGKDADFFWFSYGLGNSVVTAFSRKFFHKCAAWIRKPEIFVGGLQDGRLYPKF